MSNCHNLKIHVLLLLSVGCILQINTVSLERQRRLQSLLSAQSRFALPLWSEALEQQAAQQRSGQFEDEDAVTDNPGPVAARASQAELDDYVDYLPASEAQSLLLLAQAPAKDMTPARAQSTLLRSKLLLLSSAAGGKHNSIEARHFHKNSNSQPSIVFIMGGGGGGSPVNVSSINNNTLIVEPTTTPAAGTRTVFIDNPIYRSQPAAQYFRNHQDSGSLASSAYGLLPAAALFGLGMDGGYGYGPGSGFGNSAGVPLVPITLGGNTVRYVPLNLRGLRQAAAAQEAQEAAATPVRESEQQQQVNNFDLEDNEVGGTAASMEQAAEQLAGFKLLGMRRRQSSMGFNGAHPFSPFRRVQYLK